MGMFSTRQPRRFRRVSIYTDESRDKLQKLVDDVKREQGSEPAEEQSFDPTKFQGTFINYTPRAQKRKEGGARLGWPLALILIFALLLIWHFLMTGKRF